MTPTAKPLPSPFPVRAAIRQLLRLQPHMDLRLSLSWREGASFSARMGPRHDLREHTERAP
ncbi:MAG: hypothetical protein V4505_15405 [Pseudomonadota bacterium]